VTRAQGKTIAIRTIKLVLGLVVLAAVGRQVARTAGELSQRRESLQLDPAWLAAAVPLYLAGLSMDGLYYGRLLRSGTLPGIGAAPALRAYLISHLGKYVPGKALVVVMRATLCTPHGTRAATAAFATLYETLVMMAAGGLVAATGFALSPARSVRVSLGRFGPLSAPLWVLGLGAATMFLVVVEVRVFRRISRLVSLPFPGVGPEALPGLTPRLMLEGLLWSSLGWMLLGLSQVAVILALVPEGLPVTAWPLAVASVALATVAGFAVPVAPGGLGVREWVLWTGLGSALDHDRAVVSALALRLVWVVGELIAAAVLWPFFRKGAGAP
jgi:uncharacterized membrane protein YbhN (UPF0104 family)